MLRFNFSYALSSFILIPIICFGPGYAQEAPESSTAPVSSTQSAPASPPPAPAALQASSGIPADLAPFMKNLQDKIKRHWHINQSYPDKSRAITQFKVARDGHISELTLAQPSGDEHYNQSCLNAVKKSTPFEKLPSDFKGENVTIRFVFDYEVHQKVIGWGPPPHTISKQALWRSFFAQ